MEIDPEDTPENARAGPNRTPKRKLQKIQGARRAKRARTDTHEHDHDQQRKAFFAGLCASDPEHKKTSKSLAEEANKHFL